jgi:hypothetical protein
MAKLGRLFAKPELFETDKEALKRRLFETPATFGRRRAPRTEVAGWAVEIGKKAYPVKNWNQQGFLATSCRLKRAIGERLQIHFSIPLEGGGIETMRSAVVVRVDPKRRELAAIFSDQDEAEPAAKISGHKTRKQRRGGSAKGRRADQR